MKRDLIEEENRVLGIIQEMYGPHNKKENIVISDADEASLPIKNTNDEMHMIANISNLAGWRESGQIPSDEELKSR